jgi:hypothetical protein
MRERFVGTWWSGRSRSTTGVGVIVNRTRPRPPSTEPDGETAVEPLGAAGQSLL